MAWRSKTHDSFNTRGGGSGADLAKGTSIVYVLALPELFYTIQVIYNRTQQVIPLLMVATVWYLFITTALSVIQYYIERYFARGAVRELPPTPWQQLAGWLKR